MGTWRRALSLLAGVFVLIAAACTSGSTRHAGPATVAWGWPGSAATGWLAPGEPHVQGKRNVTIAILSPGDTHDHGYYESVVDKAGSVAARNGWRVVTVDKVPPSRAAEAARALCRRHPDMVAITASELKDAIPVASEAVCKKTVWYVAGGTGVTQTPYFVQTKDIESQSGYAAGYAAGLIMNDAHI